ncbi:MAG: BsuPI-related putative proteinase inhibitor [Bryobacter sp.]|nr:BsuPI-related putative proteinase inhibitor [Bryobacter sp.]
MKFLIVVLSLCASSGLAAEYLPLAAGNLWIYREAATGTEFSIRVAEPFAIGNQIYYSVRGYAKQPLLVRSTEDGSLVWYNQEAEREENLSSFAQLPGIWWNAPFRFCEQDGQREDSREAYVGPAGRFSAVATLKYRSYGCADEGVLEEVFAENVGMLRRVHQSIAGPRSFDLVYARVGRAEFHGAPQASFAVSVFERSDALDVVLRWSSQGSQAQELSFPTSQLWEVVLRNAAGEIVQKWSDGQAFEPKERSIVISGLYAQKLELARPAPGKYIVEAWLTTDEDAPQFRSAVAIAVQ